MLMKEWVIYMSVMMVIVKKMVFERSSFFVMVVSFIKGYFNFLLIVCIWKLKMVKIM